MGGWEAVKFTSFVGGGGGGAGGGGGGGVGGAEIAQMRLKTQSAYLGLRP